MKVTLVGVGPGAPESMTCAARAALEGADAIIGAERLLARLPAGCSAKTLALAVPEKVAAAVRANPEWRTVCVALSGDVGFYSGAKRLLELLPEYEMELVCGVSSPQYFAARLRRPWQSFHLVSAHGVACDVLAEVLNHRETLFLTGNDTTPASIIAELRRAGLDDAVVSVGENLSSADERIICGTAAQLDGQSFASLSVALVENDKTFCFDVPSSGIADEAFQRGKAPMTKREVRAVALSLLRPHVGAVLYDVGAGTGSVAVEMALTARRGRVYAIERDEENCGLIRVNRERFGVYNMDVVFGEAPGALDGLPVPDAVFIGGSKGKMREVFAAVLDRNAEARIVVSAVTLESLSGAMNAMRAFGLRDVEAVQVAATRIVERGEYHMMNAQNPVFLVAGGGRHAAH